MFRKLHHIWHCYSYTMARPGSLCAENNFDSYKNSNVVHTFLRPNYSVQL